MPLVTVLFLIYVTYGTALVAWVCVCGVWCGVCCVVVAVVWGGGVLWWCVVVVCVCVVCGGGGGAILPQKKIKFTPCRPCDNHLCSCTLVNLIQY